MNKSEVGIKALSTVLNLKQNINILNKELLRSSQDDEVYYSNVYDTIGDIITGEKLKSIVENIKNNKLGINHPSFDTIKNLQLEQDNFILNPFEVVEGVLECSKCGSNRTFSYSKQVRKADEGTTVFATCVSCKHKWSIN